MTVFMGTTQISVDKTLGEIQGILGRYGATAILVEYQGGQPTSIAFRFMVGGNEIPFRLPCRWQAVEASLDRQHRPKTYIYRGQRMVRDNKDQAKRIAWRQILRWVQAQMALVETSMVKVEEVFFPYIQHKNGGTIFEAIEKKGLTQLSYQGDSK